ncbi:MAG: hypothetical protein ABI818_19690 [Acidobacteriota bacterium]
MVRRLIGGLFVPALVLAAAVLDVSATAAAPKIGRNGAPQVTAAYSAPFASAVAQAKGRYKKQGNTCQWDANDSGPNQCTPQTSGRFKKSGDDCVWDSGGTGDDQCTPSKGRFKKDGDKCVWNASDSGPNQCNPRTAK